MNSDEQAIRDVIATWLRATREGDVDTVLTLMTPDVVFLAPGQPPMQGREIFADSMRKAQHANAVEAVSEIAEIEVCGNLAYCRTRLSVTVTSRHGNTPTLRSGHTLSILRREQDGKWRIARDANLLVESA